MSYGLTEALTFLGVTVHRMLMMLLDFSCPSWGFFLRNRRLLHEREENHVLPHTLQCLPAIPFPCLLFSQLPSFRVHEEHFLFMGVHCHPLLSDRVGLNTAVFALYCFAFQIQGLISLSFPFFQSNQVTS